MTSDLVTPQVVTSCPGISEDGDGYVWTLKKELPPPPDDLDDSDS